MIEWYKVVVAQCDNETPTKNCHGETVVQLEEDETLEQAISFLQMHSWFIDLSADDNGKIEILSCICPFCNSKIKKNKAELKLVKGGK
jgi:hypothetical protein